MYKPSPLKLKTSLRLIIISVLFALLPGCYQSKHSLIDDSLASDLGGTRYIIFRRDGKETPMVFSKRPYDKSFEIYEETDKKNKELIKLHDLTEFWRIFGKKKYVVQWTRNELQDEHHYFYAVT